MDGLDVGGLFENGLGGLIAQKSKEIELKQKEDRKERHRKLEEKRKQRNRYGYTRA